MKKLIIKLFKKMIFYLYPEQKPKPLKCEDPEPPRRERLRNTEGDQK